GHDVLLNIDVQGAESVRKRAGSDSILKRALVTVFLTPPAWAELESRLRGRGTEPEEVVQRRLSEARRELAQSPHFDYLLLSGTREEDVRRMQVILEAERLRHCRTTNPVL
ncbi:MAG TPA: guanylate kinase, partial [Roseimicrobium sp.]|nr:guanylate kinase [Roseimicrobium sp.]